MLIRTSKYFTGSVQIYMLSVGFLKMGSPFACHVEQLTKPSVTDGGACVCLCIICVNAYA